MQLLAEKIVNLNRPAPMETIVTGPSPPPATHIHKRQNTETGRCPEESP